MLDRPCEKILIIEFKINFMKFLPLCSARSQDKKILSDERLYVMIRLGYKDTKSKPVTGRLFLSPFIGEKIYTLGKLSDSVCLHDIMLVKNSLCHALVPKRLHTFIPLAK